MIRIFPLSRAGPVMRSSLARHRPAASTGPEQLERMRRAAWQAQGVVVIDPSRLADDWERQMIINIAERLFGRRANP